MLLLDVVLVVDVVMTALDVVVVMALEVVVCVDVEVDDDDVLVAADVLVVDPGPLPFVWLVLLPVLVTPEDAVPEALPPPVLPRPLLAPPDIAPLPACVPPLTPDGSPGVLPPVAPPALVVPVAEPERCDAPAPPSVDSKSTSGKVQALARAAHATTVAPLANRDAALRHDLERRMVRTSPRRRRRQA
jgi:hypothetical protein